MMRYYCHLVAMARITQLSHSKCFLSLMSYANAGNSGSFFGESVFLLPNDSLTFFPSWTNFVIFWVRSPGESARRHTMKQTRDYSELML